MKKLLNILAVASVFILLSITACHLGEAPDDIVNGPGGPVYRANFTSKERKTLGHQSRVTR